MIGDLGLTGSFTSPHRKHTALHDRDELRHPTPKLVAMPTTGRLSRTVVADLDVDIIIDRRRTAASIYDALGGRSHLA
ncbi:hypothetical protein AB8Z38_16240 [Bradyrhizobium sp. LLZ17]|uniref:Uncharacterized protein n=1 Tax=Bradyrhizobium sp. LLZ17 TaxID=3239388 RepID=A0AB39XSG0_9BRAD